MNINYNGAYDQHYIQANGDKPVRLISGTELKIARLKAGVFINDLAQSLGLMVTQIRQIESGQFEKNASQYISDNNLYHQVVHRYAESFRLDPQVAIMPQTTIQQYAEPTHSKAISTGHASRSPSKRLTLLALSGVIMVFLSLHLNPIQSTDLKSHTSNTGLIGKPNPALPGMTTQKITDRNNPVIVSLSVSSIPLFNDTRLNSELTNTSPSNAEYYRNPDKKRLQPKPISINLASPINEAPTKTIPETSITANVLTITDHNELTSIDTAPEKKETNIKFTGKSSNKTLFRTNPDTARVQVDSFIAQLRARVQQQTGL